MASTVAASRAEEEEPFSGPPPSGRYFEAYSHKSAHRFDAVWEWTDAISPAARQVLQRVYVLLAGTCLACACGVLVAPVLPEAARVAVLVASVALLLALAVSSTAHPAGWRALALLAYGLCSGVLVGPLVARSDARVVAAAAGVTALIFACFSLAALLATSRKFLYLHGILASCLLGLVGLSVLNIFFAVPWFSALWLYGGLILFSLFVVVDTQIILERAEHGDCDVVFAALDLFLDMLNIFVRVLIILNRSRER